MRGEMNELRSKDAHHGDLGYVLMSPSDWESIGVFAVERARARRPETWKPPIIVPGTATLVPRTQGDAVTVVAEIVSGFVVAAVAWWAASAWRVWLRAGPGRNDTVIRPSTTSRVTTIGNRRVRIVVSGR